jgi:hypothetical protein
MNTIPETTFIDSSMTPLIAVTESDNVLTQRKTRSFLYASAALVLIGTTVGIVPFGAQYSLLKMAVVIFLVSGGFALIVAQTFLNQVITRCKLDKNKHILTVSDKDRTLNVEFESVTGYQVFYAAPVYTLSILYDFSGTQHSLQLYACTSERRINLLLGKYRRFLDRPVSVVKS